MSILGDTHFYIRGKDIDPESIKIKVAKLKFDLPEFLILHLGELIDEEIVQVIKDRILSAGFSKKIAESTRIVRTEIKSGIIWKVVSDYKTVDGFPVAIMIENGRRAFFLKPKNKKALSWVPKGGGKRAFSKGHWIPEFVGRKFVQDTINEKKGIIQKKMDIDTKNYIMAVLGDLPLPVAKIFSR